jgi:putative flavoprotein involved in K+ transport
MTTITAAEAKITADEQTADEQLDKWLSRFDAAASAANIDALVTLFHADACWRDFLAFTWNIRTAEGQNAIRKMLGACLARTAPLAWQRTTPARRDDEIVEGMATFETTVARCKAVVRLKHGKARTLFTCMSELKKLDKRRDARHASQHPSGHEDVRINRPRHVERSETPATTHQPYCVIVGAGHCGIGLGAQLRQLGVPTLIVDKSERPSDTWRNRHDPLSLHSPSYFDQMAGFSYPANWPLHPTKDQFANWLDAYQSMMDLDVWASAECVAADFDDARGKWRLHIRRCGRTIEINPEQLVLATGILGAPKVPDIAGKERFKGLQRHAGLYRRSPDFSGGRCIVVGSGTTAHDVAADLWASGAHVTMIQRSPTIVMKLEALLEGFSQLYGDEAKTRGITTELADLLFAATPMRGLAQMHQRLVAQLKQRHAAFYKGLERAGFQLTFGEDESGVFPQIPRDPDRLEHAAIPPATTLMSAPPSWSSTAASS